MELSTRIFPPIRAGAEILIHNIRRCIIYFLQCLEDSTKEISLFLHSASLATNRCDFTAFPGVLVSPGHGVLYGLSSWPLPP